MFIYNLMASELQPLLPPDWRLDEKAAFLADMREVVQGNEHDEPYPGYPTLSGRLYVPAGELQYDVDGRPVFPSDPNASCTVFDHSVNENPRPASAFHDNGGPLPPDEAAKISWGDMGTDSRGFPLHRYATAMVTDPTVGLIIGPGYYWHPGKKLTVDLGVAARGLPSEAGVNEFGVTPAVQATPEQLAMGGLYLSVLAVRRGDTKQLALPGGDIDKGEDALTAALREASEEAGLTFDTAISQGKRLVADPRLTSSTETESDLFVIDAGSIPAERPVGGDDADAADWLVADSNLLVPRRFFGSHRRMLLEVVDWYQNQHDVTVMENGLIVPNQNS